MQKFISRRFHIIVDAWNCKENLLADRGRLSEVIREIANMCDMKIMHGPVVLEGVPSNPGLTGFSIIDFSHISIHTFTASKEICVDIFSCKPFDYEGVKNYVRENYGLKEKYTKIIHVKHS